jgi:hypothetical protein
MTPMAQAYFKKVGVAPTVAPAAPAPAPVGFDEAHPIAAKVLDAVTPRLFTYPEQAAAGIGQAAVRAGLLAPGRGEFKPSRETQLLASLSVPPAKADEARDRESFAKLKPEEQAGMVSLWRGMQEELTPDQRDSLGKFGALSPREQEDLWLSMPGSVQKPIFALSQKMSREELVSALRGAKVVGPEASGMVHEMLHGDAYAGMLKAADAGLRDLGGKGETAAALAFSLFSYSTSPATPEINKVAGVFDAVFKHLNVGDIQIAPELKGKPFSELIQIPGAFKSQSPEADRILEEISGFAPFVVLGAAGEAVRPKGQVYRPLTAPEVGGTLERPSAPTVAPKPTPTLPVPGTEPRPGEAAGPPIPEHPEIKGNIVAIDADTGVPWVRREAPAVAAPTVPEVKQPPPAAPPITEKAGEVKQAAPETAPPAEKSLASPQPPVAGPLQPPERAVAEKTTVGTAAAKETQEGVVSLPPPKAAPKPLATHPAAVLPAGKAELKPPARTPGPYILGHGSELITPSGKQWTHYKVVEAGDLIASHDPNTFAPNPEYPALVQERRYDLSKDAQQRVIQQAQTYDPSFTINTNPDAVNGPPIVTTNSTVLGGNSRVMSTQRIYRAGKGDAYRNRLVQSAEVFGLKPDEVQKFKEPVLVRVLDRDPGDIEQARRVAQGLNRSFTGALGINERAVSAGRSITFGTLESLDGWMQQMGPDASIRDVLRDHPKQILSALERDGVITDRERPQFTDPTTGGFSEAGKNFVERALLGSVIDDVNLLENAPKSVMNRVEGGLADLARLKAREDEWDITPLVRESLRDYARMTASGAKVEDYLGQPSMFGPAREPAVDAMIRFLQGKKADIKKGFRQFAQDAQSDVKAQGTLGLAPPPDATQSFNDAFRGKTSEEDYLNGIAKIADQENLQTGRAVGVAEAQPGRGGESRQPETPTAAFPAKPTEAVKVAPSHPAVAGFSAVRKAKPRPVPEHPAAVSVPVKPGPSARSTGLRSSVFGLDIAAEKAKELAPVIKRTATDLRDGLREVLDPTLKPADIEMGIIRERSGELARERERFAYAMKSEVKRWASKTPDESLDFIDRMEKGKPQANPQDQALADALRSALDERRKAVQALGTGKLEHFYENYFPHIWEDVTKATDIFRRILSGRKPLAGPASFLKQRAIPDTRAGVHAGLKPVTWNPVELAMLKVHEMDRYIMAHRILNEMKERGLAKYVSVFNKPEEGLAPIDDRIATVYGPPEVGIKEAFDQKVVDGLNAVAKNIGVTHKREVAIGGKRWGYAEAPPMSQITTKFAGPESVTAHEIGHQLDFKYGLKEQLVNNPRFKKELRALTDLHFEGGEASTAHRKYLRKGEEKMAAMLEALIHAPDKFKQAAPNTYRFFTDFLKSHEELKPILDIKPSLVLGTGEASVGTGGVTIRGRYYAPEGVANVLNNYLSPGLERNAAYRLMRGAGNTLNQAQLGMSAFHLMFTSMDASISDFALALEHAAAGKPQAGIVPAVRAFSLLGSPINTYIKGNRLLKEYLEPGRYAEMSRLADAIVEAGGRIRMDRFYKWNAIGSFWKAWKEGKWPSGVLKVVPAALEYAAKPLMEHLVPRQKLGVFTSLAEKELRRLGPDASKEQVREALGKVWDSVDNRMGQLVYDNLFWNKAFKDLGMIAVRSLGWNLGTVREIGGGLKDFAKQPFNLAAGVKPQFTHRMAYVVALPIVVGWAGAVTQFLYTGKGPEELKDYFFPKTGDIGSDGRPERVSLATYMKDVYAVFHHPVQTVAHKLHPLINAMVEMVTNEDFYRTEIRHKDDPLVAQMLDVTKFLAKQFLPFSARNAAKVARDEGQTGLGVYFPTTGRKLATYVGIVPAPAYIKRSDFENRVRDYIQTQMPQGPRTKEQAEKTERTSLLRGKLATGKMGYGELGAMQRRGEITSEQMARLIRTVDEGPLVSDFRRLPLHVALEMWPSATDAEKDKLREWLEVKAESLSNYTPEQADVLERKLRDALTGSSSRSPSHHTSPAMHPSVTR